jgi:hypothetical protein
MIASLHDENNHIAIPGFYNDVLNLTPDERTALNSAPIDEDEYKKDLALMNYGAKKAIPPLSVPAHALL